MRRNTNVFFYFSIFPSPSIFSFSFLFIQMCVFSVFACCFAIFLYCLSSYRIIILPASLSVFAYLYSSFCFFASLSLQCFLLCVFLCVPICCGIVLISACLFAFPFVFVNHIASVYILGYLSHFPSVSPPVPTFSVHLFILQCYIFRLFYFVLIHLSFPVKYFYMYPSICLFIPSSK